MRPLRVVAEVIEDPPILFSRTIPWTGVRIHVKDPLLGEIGAEEFHPDTIWQSHFDSIWEALGRKIKAHLTERKEP